MGNRQTKDSEDKSSRDTDKKSIGINETLPNNDAFFVLHIMTKHNDLIPIENKISKHLCILNFFYTYKNSLQMKIVRKSRALLVQCFTQGVTETLKTHNSKK